MGQVPEEATMGITTIRIAALCALALAAAPAEAQRVRYDHNGQADVVATNFTLVEAALAGQVIGRPVARLGQVVFFRPERAASGEVMVRDGGREMRALPEGQWFVALVAPGEHAFDIDGGRIAVKVQPGRSYFVRVAGTAEAPRLSRSSPIGFLVATGSRPMPQL
jgi:hypothetical protein